MKKILVVVSAVLLVSLAIAIVGCQSPAGPAVETKPAVQNLSIVLGEGKIIGEVGEKNEITGEFHRWEPSVLVVHKGDTINLTVTNPRSKVHSFILPDFGVTTPGLEPRGGTTTVQFIADKVGTFQYACGIPFDRDNGALDCNLDHKRQVGTLIVLER